MIGTDDRDRQYGEGKCLTLALTYDAANPTLAFAAGELARHIARLGLPAGGAYPVTLAVQPEAFAQENDSYRCAFTPAGGEICAGSARAVLLGVYAYLRALGFLFMQPGETFVPSVASPAALCLSLSHTAAHRQRGVCIEGANSLRNALAMIDWLPKLGMNAFFIQFKQPDTFFSRWYAHELNPLRQGRPLSRRALDRMDAAMAKAAALRGLELHRAGHGWTAEALGFSAGGWQAGGALPAERASLCALVDGKRALFGGVPANTNLCLSRPAARRALADHICAYALAHPEADVLHVWLADECNNVCECPSCQASLPAEPFIALLGDVDARLTQLGLPARIAFPLYQELLYPPQRVRLTGRFLMMFAPISRTFESPYPRALPGGRATALYPQPHDPAREHRGKPRASSPHGGARLAANASFTITRWGARTTETLAAWPSPG